MAAYLERVFVLFLEAILSIVEINTAIRINIGVSDFST